jgi:quinoprotein glucose dehydrogenase
MKKAFISFIAVGVITGAFTLRTLAQNTTAGRDWAFPLGDPGATRFSSLNQINTSNVQNLTRAWTFHTQSGRFAYPPMVVDSVMYFTAPNGVFAVDAVTGQQIWKYPATSAAPAPTPVPAARGQRGAAPGEDEAGGGRGGGRGGGAGTAVRGPVYWAGTQGIGPRIYSQLTEGLAAIDAKTGELVKTFGTSGVIPGVHHNSPPAIYKNLIVTRGEDEGVKGSTIKAYDVATGQPRWTFYLKAQPDDSNRASWLNNSADTTAAPGLWGTFTVDEQRGTIFVPIKKVNGPNINDYWGGGAPGNDLYSDCLVALDAATGKVKWYQQLVHHDIWDYDLAAAPLLFEVRRNGQVIPAVAQSTKMSLLFTFNRETGEPIFGMEERPVPQTNVPGEWTSPTQPFPVKPPPLARNTFKKADLSTVTPEHKAFCEDLWEKNELTDAVPYAAWKVGGNTLVFPGAEGGSNWWGMTFDRPLGLLIGNVHNAGQWGQLTLAGAGGQRRGQPTSPAAPGNAPTGYTKTPGPFTRFWNNENEWSCTEPPWGELVAVNANTGDIAWRVPLGEFDELTKKGVKPTGTPNSGGAISTAGNLVFIGATIDGYFRAFDARDGKELWRDKLPAPSQGTPTTYTGRDGKQYVVVGANGGGFFGAKPSDEVIAYRLK